jgi:hypothetical protein
MIRMSSRPSARARVCLLIVIIICQSLGRGVQGEGLVADCKEITREMGLQSEGEGLFADCKEVIIPWRERGRGLDAGEGEGLVADYSEIINPES